MSARAARAWRSVGRTRALAASDAFQHILYWVEDGVAYLVLNTPERLNALSAGPGSTREEIISALALADADEAVGCVLISATGRAFCAGGDLSKIRPRETTLDERRFSEGSARFARAVRSCETPTVAAVNGLCLGAGLALIAHCDIVLAADDARFGLVEGALGLPIPPEVVPVVGPAWAKFLIFTGEMVEADIAREMGLVLATFAPERLMEAADSLARRIARTPRGSTRLNKMIVNSVTDAMGLEGALTAGHAHAALTAAMSRHATAPDGRRFRDILDTEGPAGARRAYAQPPWFAEPFQTRRKT